MIRLFITTFLLCVLLSPVPVFADLQQPTPIGVESVEVDTEQLPADSTEPPASDTVPLVDLAELTLLLAAQEEVAQELAGLHDFLVEIWQHVRFWAVAALAYWFAKQSWQGVT